MSLALALAAGFDVDRERQQIVREHRPTLGEVVRTSGGGLPCRYLYHAITIDFDRNASMDEAALRKLIANLLKQATADGVPLDRHARARHGRRVLQSRPRLRNHHR